jgi:hypothetical protein
MKKTVTTPAKAKPVLVRLGPLQEPLEKYVEDNRCKNLQEGIREILKGHFHSAQATNN